MLLQDQALTPWNEPFLSRSVQSQRGLNTVRSSVLFASPINPKALMATFSCFLSLKHSEKNWIVENLTTVGLVCCVLRMEEVDCHCMLEICTDHTGKNWWKMISWWPHPPARHQLEDVCFSQWSYLNSQWPWIWRIGSKPFLLSS